jgi:diguanylate cyclase (GGDEF)-like protein
MMRPPIPERETERLADLHELDILDSLPEQAYDDLTRIAAGICGTPIGAVTLIDSDRQWFKSKLGIDASETSRDTAFCAHALITPDELFIVSDAQSDARFSGNPSVTGDPHVRFYAGAPLVTQKGTALGALCVVDTTPRTLEPFQYEALRGLSRQVVALMELRRATKQLRHQLREREWYEAQLKRENASLAEQSRTDALTGLPNRRSLDASLERAITSARDSASPLCVALIDVDHFKTINDLHGHAEGDRVLVGIAQALHAQRGLGGFVARYGGEEFAMLLPSTPLDAAELQADYVRLAVENLSVGLPVTVSIGVAQWRDDETAADVGARADAALYRAKHHGRNRVEIDA